MREPSWRGPRPTGGSSRDFRVLLPLFLPSQLDSCKFRGHSPAKTMSGRGTCADEPCEAGGRAWLSPGCNPRGPLPQTAPRPAARETQSPGEDPGRHPPPRPGQPSSRALCRKSSETRGRLSCHVKDGPAADGATGSDRTGATAKGRRTCGSRDGGPENAKQVREREPGGRRPRSWAGRRMADLRRRTPDARGARRGGGRGARSGGRGRWRSRGQRTWHPAAGDGVA